jgi:predicted nucleotidyltransferase
MQKHSPETLALFVTKVGSQLYGTATENSDVDFKGFCLPKMEQLLGMDTFEQQEYNNKEPDGPTKMEGQIYSVKKFLHLSVIKGNPTMLEVSFAPEKFWMHSTPLGLDVTAFIRKNSVTKRMFPAYSAYHKAQMHKLMNAERTGKRAVIIEEHGFDVKFMTHAYRLAVQCIHAMKEGVIKPQLEGDELKMALDMRFGKISLQDGMSVLKEVDEKMYEAYKASKIMEEPDYEKCNKFLEEIQKKYICNSKENRGFFSRIFMSKESEKFSNVLPWKPF